MKSNREANPATKELSEAELENVAGGGKASPQETPPTEAISLHFGSIAWTYTQ
jgi:type VI protein secretion system component Hcp